MQERILIMLDGVHGTGVVATNALPDVQTIQPITKTGFEFDTPPEVEAIKVQAIKTQIAAEAVIFAPNGPAYPGVGNT